ncbi:mitochondrial carrier homolog 1 isoform X1 [Pelodiscus sinensis]|uniref:mitochondrial carrier homolog 1 isoform X1 n=1 Tax=Pelodiscus sinensis TaxID=13735 RepID=UPI003F6D06E6
MAAAATLPGGPRAGARPEPLEGAESLFVVLGAGLTALSHPLLYAKLLVQVGHEPLPPTIGRNVLGRKVLYLPGFFTYAKHIVAVDGKTGLFRGLAPRILSSTLSTVTRGTVKKVFPVEDMEHVSNKDDVKTSLRKVMKETSHEMLTQCMSRVISHPLHVISVRCMVQFVGREVKYSGVLSSIGRIFKEEGILGFFVGLVPHILGDVVFLWCCNILAHFINTYAVDDSFSQASVIRSYTKFVMGIAVSMLTYPFLLVGDLMAVNNCGGSCSGAPACFSAECLPQQVSLLTNSACTLLTRYLGWERGDTWLYRASAEGFSFESEDQSAGTSCLLSSEAGNEPTCGELGWSPLLVVGLAEVHQLAPPAQPAGLESEGTVCAVKVASAPSPSSTAARSCFRQPVLGR